ncbi:MAG: flagellar hook-basal body complex protein FliE [Thermodesulfobacteriota bacterium]
MNEITMRPVAAAGSTAPGIGPAKPAGPQGFGDILRQAVSSVNGQMQEANALQEGLAAGQHANIHETMIAAEKAGISFRMLTRAQQKVIDAYREIMRMQM